MVTMVTDTAKVEVQNLMLPKSPSPVKTNIRAERSTSYKERKNKKEHIRLERHNSVGWEDQSVSRLVACLSTLDRLVAVLISWTGACYLPCCGWGTSSSLCSSFGFVFRIHFKVLILLESNSVCHSNLYDN